MKSAEEAPRVNIYGLTTAIENFISYNRGSDDHEVRWLASEAIVPLLNLIRRVKSGGLDESEKKAVTDFRLNEIEARKTTKLREIEDLEREARKISA